jgi:ABC-type uncharacterized transport system permease subunit
LKPVLFDLSLVLYVVATGLSLAHLIQRQDLVHRMASTATLAGFTLHTVALIARTVERGQPPFGSFPEANSVAVWASVLLLLWAERQYAMKVLGAFVLPVVVVLSVWRSMVMPAALQAIAPTLHNVWITIHVGLALVGIAAFVLNFAGGIMYLIQEQQLKARRPGAFYYRLPSLETLDRLTFRTLTLGFPFLTVGLMLGAVWAGRLDPLIATSAVAWTIYAFTLAGRTVAGWRGRRAAYYAIIGFAALVLTLGAGFLMPGPHGS